MIVNCPLIQNCVNETKAILTTRDQKPEERTLHIKFDREYFYTLKIQTFLIDSYLILLIKFF